MKPTRTRFAPSPTGFLHVGGIRTALFAWLIARQNNGQFILRFEDTDKKREVPGSREHLIESLKVLGLVYDEGPDIGGPFAPYTQSERLDTYKAWAQKLIDSGRAYADPYSPEQVQSFREEAQKAKLPFLYRNHRPDNPPIWDGTQPLRFKSDPKSYDRVDAVMGDLHTGPEVVDDFVLIKSDGYPTYNFAHIVDDAEMQITHVIRGQEFLSSTPNYLNLYEALVIEAPIIATVPHIMNDQGNKKLGKRDGAKDVLDYIREGYIPDAMINFIASLGWNDGTEQEIFSISELIKKFSLERVQKSGARFDEQRLLWMNGAYIRALSINELYEQCQEFLPDSAKSYDKDYQKQVLGLVKERLKYFAELPELTSYFFEEPAPKPDLIANHKQLAKLSGSELQELLLATIKALTGSDFALADVTDRLNQLLGSTQQEPAVLFSLIRIATTWAPFSPSLADSLVVLGKEQTMSRLNKAVQALANN